MVNLDFIKQTVLRFLPLIVGILLISTKGMANAPQKLEVDWFEKLGIDHDGAGLWGPDTPWFDWETEWADEAKIKEEIYKVDEAVGIKSGKVSKVKMAYKALATIKKEVAEGTFFTSGERYRTGELNAAKKAWEKALPAWFGGDYVKYKTMNDESVVEEIQKAMPFGPWVIWGEHPWDEVVFDWDRAKRRQQRDQEKYANSMYNNTTSNNTPSDTQYNNDNSHNTNQRQSQQNNRKKSTLNLPNLAHAPSPLTNTDNRDHGRNRDRDYEERQRERSRDRSTRTDDYNNRSRKNPLDVSQIPLGNSLSAKV